MQLCQINFYQKIARKKVARVNAALHTVRGAETRGGYIPPYNLTTSPPII